jgi:hypothetical protein
LTVKWPQLGGSSGSGSGICSFLSGRFGTV